MQTIQRTYLTAARSITLAQEAPPAPAAGEVLIELTAVGVCGSDVHYYEEGRIGDSYLTEPLTLGHEPAGIVRGVGEGVDSALVGKRVAIEPAIHCGHCPFCLEGDTNICPDVRFLGTPPTQGAFRQMLTHPAHLVAPLPDSVSDGVGALLEPLAIGVHTIDLAAPPLGSTIVIQGAGTVGLCVLMAARLTAPARLIVIEPLAYRRELALSLGADLAFSPDDPDVVREVARVCGGWGADRVIEAVGEPASFAQMVQFARPGGVVTVVGIDALDRFAMSGATARRKGLTLRMVRRSRHTLERAIAITVGGHWRPEAILTHRRPLASLSETLDMVAGYRDGVVKAIVDPTA